MGKRNRMLYIYLDYLYREVGLQREDVDLVPTYGRADDACSIIADKEYVIRQFAYLSYKQLRQVACALCDQPKIKSRKEAIMYIVWIAALGIQENSTIIFARLP